MADCSIDVLCRVTTEEMRCTYCSPSAARVLGWEPAEMVTRFLTELIHPDDALQAQGAHFRYVNEEDSELGIGTMRVLRKDGSYAWVAVNGCLMRDPATDAPWQVLLNMRDVGEQVRREQQLEALALTDALTGLANRRAFDQALEREWRRARRDHGPISLLLLDLDNFKGVNDAYGHLAGDECLRTIGETLAARARRPGDVTARFGGEEFAVILPATDAAGAAIVAEHLRSEIEALDLPRTGGRGPESAITASVGVATAEIAAGKIAAEHGSLVQAADRALYRAKHGGRNRVETEKYSQAS